MDRETRGILNKRAYKYFVVQKAGLDSGWEYKEDANDRKRELAEEGITAKVLMRVKAKAVLEGRANPRRKSRKNPPDALTVCREVNRRGELTEALVRKIFLKADESHLYPVRGRFNATQRAIRRLYKAVQDGLVIDTPYEYAAALDAEISNVVNDPGL